MRQSLQCDRQMRAAGQACIPCPMPQHERNVEQRCKETFVGGTRMPEVSGDAAGFGSPLNLSRWAFGLSLALTWEPWLYTRVLHF